MHAYKPNTRILPPAVFSSAHKCRTHWMPCASPQEILGSDHDTKIWALNAWYKLSAMYYQRAEVEIGLP